MDFCAWKRDGKYFRAPRRARDESQPLRASRKSARADDVVPATSATRVAPVAGQQKERVRRRCGESPTQVQLESRRSRASRKSAPGDDVASLPGGPATSAIRRSRARCGPAERARAPTVWRVSQVQLDSRPSRADRKSARRHSSHGAGQRRESFHRRWVQFWMLSLKDGDFDGVVGTGDGCNCCSLKDDDFDGVVGRGESAANDEPEPGAGRKRRAGFCRQRRV